MHRCAPSTFHLWSTLSISKGRKCKGALDTDLHAPSCWQCSEKPMWAQPSCVIQQTQFHTDDMHWIGSPGWRDPLFVARKKAPQDSSETRGCCMGNTTRSDMKAFAQRKKIVVLSLNTRTYFPGAEKGSLQNPCREGIRYILWSLNLSAVLIPVSLSVVIAVASFFLHPALFAWWQC